MRFAWVMAAMAALWMQPAQAVTILLGATPEAGLRQKITLTGLGPSDVISATGYLGEVTAYWWEKPGGGDWYLNGNEFLSVGCSTVGGHCSDGGTLTSAHYPVKAIGSLDIDIIGNEIIVDWTKFASADLCGSIAEADRVSSFGAYTCGFNWLHDASLSFDVEGPNSRSFGYTIAPLSPVPEPKSWALAIIGIGMAGATLRRRSTLTDSAHFASL